MAANGMAPSNQTHLHNELVMQRPVVAELVLQPPSRRISFMHKKRKRERKLKIVDGEWGWGVGGDGDGAVRSKEAEPLLKAATKARLELSSNLAMAHSQCYTKIIGHCQQQREEREN